MTALKDALQRFKEHEQAWLSSHSSILPDSASGGNGVHHDGHDHHSLDETSCHYGELAFLLLGLKPMVLVQMPTRQLAQNYHAQVLRPHLIHYPPLASYHLHSLEITTDLQSPEMSLKGSIIVWRDETADRIRPLLDLTPSFPQLVTKSSCPTCLSSCKNSASTITACATCSPSSVIASADSSTTRTISEETLAALLDYPGRLPQSPREYPTMVEVSYWDNVGPTLLTAYAAQKDQLELIRLHFACYRDAMLKHLGIHLKLQVVDMAAQHK
ncbi:hypothetical protein BGW42_001991 [Actinomortierella wolfii]|nr:hypothetical protein BGW42_001991 [Actinomortierella wolfii]